MEVSLKKAVSLPAAISSTSITALHEYSPENLKVLLQDTIFVPLLCLFPSVALGRSDVLPETVVPSCPATSDLNTFGRKKEVTPVVSNVDKLNAGPGLISCALIN